jgi:hypothetical protein
MEIKKYRYFLNVTRTADIYLGITDKYVQDGKICSEFVEFTISNVQGQFGLKGSKDKVLLGIDRISIKNLSDTETCVVLSRTPNPKSIDDLEFAVTLQPNEEFMKSAPIGGDRKDD